MLLKQYCIGIWKVRFMNQGKSEVVKQEMARVNINILGISELKWNGMGEFNSDDHFIYYYWQESLRKNGVALTVNKSVWNAVVGCNLKNNRMISVRFQGKPFNITVIQVFTPTSNAEEAEVEWFYEGLEDILEPTHSRTNTPKRCPLHYWGLVCKSRKSRDTCSNREVWSWSTKWNRTKVNRVFPREHSKHPLPKHERTLHMDITRWSTPQSDWLYSLQLKMEKLYTVSKNKTGNWLWLRSWTPYCQIQTQIQESRENH